MKEIARLATLTLGAFATIAAAACAGAPTTPEPAARLPAGALFSVEGSVTTTDSVVGGYGSGSTGGLEYEEFEYEPETGTEYVATSDSTATTREMTPTPTGPTSPKP